MGRKSKQREALERFVYLRAQAKPYEEISKELGVDEATLVKWSRGKSHDIANLRAIRYEKVRTQAFATQETRANLIGSRIDAIKQELEKRNLSTLSTKELEELLLKYVAIQEKCSESVTFTVQSGEYDFETETWRG